MRIIADLHIHSRFSRATSKNLTIKNIEKYARLKGLNLLGTGDFTHPKWINELKSELIEDETGILKTQTGFNFLLQTEVSLIYSSKNKVRKIHLILLAKNFEIVDQITDLLKLFGRVDYDGRPIFGVESPEFVEKIKSIDKSIEIIPAHVWTPWFGLFGSNSGFDSVEECFQDQSKHIHALETGLSSDPSMNWRLSSLDKYTLVSNSDSHSYWPWRIGRECNIFEVKRLTYGDIIKVIRTREGFVKTVEVDPAYGKYHIDGHRFCNVGIMPQQSMLNNNLCPKCGKKLTIGVLHRVEELADRPPGFIPKNAVPFASLIPLSEIIAELIGSSPSSQRVWREYYKLVNLERTELDVIMNLPFNEIAKFTDEKIAKAIVDVREGKIPIKPGYDGKYGYPIFPGVAKSKKSSSKNSEDARALKNDYHLKEKQNYQQNCAKQKDLTQFIKNK